MKSAIKSNAKPSGNNSGWWKTRKARVISVIIAIAILSGFALWWLAFRPFVSTDDARVASSIIRVANQGISGQIIRIFVNEGDFVKKDMLLLELDHRTAEVQLERAMARARFASLELSRMENLARNRGISQQQLDKTRTEQRIAEAEARLSRIAVERTYLKSPSSGIIIQKNAETGNILETNQTAFTIADIDNAWITANIEETSVSLVRTGQSVRIYLDEGSTLTGKVQEIRMAVASTFALIPADNSQGNFIKQVQRIPVKIKTDPHPDVMLRIGQSAEIRIKVR